jgi:hypothetical protein
MNYTRGAALRATDSPDADSVAHTKKTFEEYLSRKKFA